MSNYKATILADTPVAYWQLAEASGTTAVDEIGGANNAAYQNTPTLGVAGPLAGDSTTAVTFVKTSSEYAKIASPTSALNIADVFSIEFWVKRAAATNGETAVYSRGSSGPAVYFENDNFVYMVKEDVALVAHSTTALTSTTVYYYVAITKNGSTRHVYINGADNTTLGTNATMSTAAGVVGIAANYHDTQQFDGTLAQIAVYNYELTSGQVAAHYAAGVNFLGLPTAAAMVMAGGTPSVSAPQTYVPTSAALSLTGSVPAVIAPIQSIPAAAAMVTAFGTPVVTLGDVVIPDAAALSLAFGTPLVTIAHPGTPLPPGIKGSIVRTGQITGAIQ